MLWGYLFLFFAASAVVLGERTAPFTQRWTIKSASTNIVLSRSLPVGVFLEGKSIFGFSSKDGSILWQANHTISYEGTEYFPSLGRSGVVSSENLLITNYAFTLDIPPNEELSFQGYYLWDLPVHPFS